jgi:hypothetical protein
VDKEPDRLALAGRYGTTPVNFADADPVQVITDATDGAGVDCGVEAVGYQAHDAAGQERPEMVLDKLVEIVRATGRIGVVGVYNPEDSGAADEGARQGPAANVSGVRLVRPPRPMAVGARREPRLALGPRPAQTSHAAPSHAGGAATQPARRISRQAQHGPGQTSVTPPGRQA